MWFARLAAVASAWCTVQAAVSIEFNRDIRPLLSDRCFACHGPDQSKRQSKLRLDIEADAKADLGGGRTGIAPGDLERSEVYKRLVTANQAMRMPPAWAGHSPLAAAQIERIRLWIEQGAPYQSHYAFLPPRKADPPTTRNKTWPRNAIDRFVLARLEKEGWQPSAEADPSRLARRVTLDLTGLPPTPAEVGVFAQDTAGDAYERMVDRLLASPRYAERMAIRWLEAARYADTNGYQTDGPRDMWRWRDWVIDAFHSNMPFDRFTVEQIAGDLLPDARLSQKIATAFHRNHRTSAEGGIVDEEFRVEYVADRTETTATVWLGLTLGCARCHDHKYDPFTQRDYYSLFAFFNNVPEKGFVYNFGNEEPYIKAPLPEQQVKLDQYARRAAAARARVEELSSQTQEAQVRWEKRARGLRTDWTITAGQVFHAPLDAASGIKAAGCGENEPVCALEPADGRVGHALRFDGQRYLEAPGENTAKFNYRDPFTFAAWTRPKAPDGAILSKAEDYFEGAGHALYLIKGKLRVHVIFRWTDLGMRLETAEPLALNEWQHITVTYDGGMKASGVHVYVNGRERRMNVLFDQCIWPIDFRGPFRIGAGGGMRFHGLIDEVRVYNRALSPSEAAVLALLDPIARIASLEPASRTKAQADKLRMCFLEQHAPSKVKQALAALAAAERERAAYYDTIPTVMVMAERAEERPTFVLRRGAYDAPGAPVDAAVPASLGMWKPEWPRNRLGLARWLVDRSNPLTARVAVNRFWQMLFGTGLVKTVEDFGSQGEWPVHPELLDWLAVEFMDSGWNVKHLLKTIVTSATYRQSSKLTPELVQRDPENRLLARGPRTRLAPEMVRDQALSVSGLLVERTGGPSVRPYQPPGLWQELHGGKGYEPDKGEGLYRRSLYTYWKRTVAPPAMVNFDSPSRENCVVRETRTNTPLQALNLMNDVTYVEAARKLAERMLVEGGTEPEGRIRYGFRLTLARDPREQEARLLAGALERFRAFYAANQAEAARLVSQGEAPRHRKLNAAVLAAYTSVASLMLNLDETVTKE